MLRCLKCLPVDLVIYCKKWYVAWRFLTVPEINLTEQVQKGQISKMWTFLFFIQIWCSFVVVFLCKMPYLMSYHIYQSIKKSYLFYFGKETEPNLKGIENFYFTSNFDAHFIFEMIVSKLYVSVLISPASLRIKWIKRLPKKYKILFFIKV